MLHRVMRMALYTIGDLHLSFGVNKPMDVFGDDWSNHIEKIKAGFSILNDEDVIVICGDTSWGISFEESLDDFKFLNGLPGKKIVLKGNHDYWWSTAAKMNKFLSESGCENIKVLHNNCFYYENTAICGTRGWMHDHEENSEQNKKIVLREAGRLRTSLQSAKPGFEKICFLHYPPRFNDVEYEEIIEVINEFDVKKCYYGHIHGSGHHFAVTGEVDGICYNMISADFLNFVPKIVLE